MADAVVCVSDSVADEALRYYGVEEKRVTVVFNGVDVDRFSPVGGNVRSRLGLNDRRVLLYVGALNSRKRLDLLIESLQWMTDDYVLMVAGSGPSQAGLGALIHRLGLTDRVRLLGPIDTEDLPALYRTADVFCLTSLSEGLPKVVLEALASGLKVASTRCFRAPHDISRMVTWLDAEMPEALAEEIVAADHAGPPIGGRECTVRSFTWEAVARRIDDVYARVR
jgi:glycosyltransferase involved in cell wall biosynthesis